MRRFNRKVRGDYHPVSFDVSVHSNRVVFVEISRPSELRDAGRNR